MQCTIISIAMGLGLAGLAAGAQPAGDLPPLQPGQTVELQGCVRPGVEYRCLIVQTRGRTYDVTGLGLRQGDYAHGTAVVTPVVSYCMQGVRVANYKADVKPPNHCPSSPQ